MATMATHIDVEDDNKSLIITKGKKRLIIRKTAQTVIQAPAQTVIQAQAQTVIQAPALNKIDQYISQLSAQEKIVFKIAQEHLESSFDMEKSIGYKDWLKNNN